MRRTALITGSSGLIGTTLCEEFLSAGYRVFGLDVKAPRNFHHDQFQFLKCDLSSENSIMEAVSQLDSLHVLINNAAATELTFKKFEEVTLEEWNKGIAINLTSAFLLSQYTHPFLKKSKGSIINISSTRHLMSEPDTVIYSASKGGLLSLTHSLAITLGQDGIRVNAISPGWIDKVGAKHSEKDKSQHPVGRVGVPHDIAQMALFLSGEAAGFITGQDHIIDGGMTKKMIYV